MISKLLILIVVVLGIAMLARRKRAAPPPALVRLADIPHILKLVSESRRDGTFAVLLFGERGQPPAEQNALNIQFSVEGGRAGLDWVLLAPANIAARDRVVSFFDGRGSPLEAKTMNDVSYLRTETGDLAELCRDVLRSVFGVSDTQEMRIVPEGFLWKPTSQATAT